MKKYLIIVLSILLLFSFTSCEKDKSAEVADNFVNFCDAVNYGYASSQVFDSTTIESNCKADKSFEILLASTDDIIDEDSLYTFWDDYLKTLADEYYASSGTFKCTNKTGTITGTYTDINNYSINMSDVTLSYEYAKRKRYEAETDYGTPTETVTLSGSVSYAVDSNNILTAKVDVTVNAKAYKCEYKVNLDTSKFVSGSYNGVEVDSKLLTTLIVEVIL